MGRYGKPAVHGTLERSLDSRLRITISSEFEALFQDKDDPILCYWKDFSLALMPESVFKDFVQQMMASPKDLKLQAFRNFFLANANKVSVDSNHRVTLRKQDLAYLRKTPKSANEKKDSDGKEFDWRQELVLTGQYNYIVIQTAESAGTALPPELMPEYGEYLEESCISMQQTLLEKSKANEADKD